MTTEGALAFAGGEEWLASPDIDALILERQAFRDGGVAPKVALINAAAAYENGMANAASIINRLTSLGASVEDSGLYMRADAEKPDVIHRLRNARVIYIADGSPLHLRSVLKDSAAWSALMDAWRNGATVLGSGAGATVLSDPMVDPRGGALTLGLQMTKGLVVVPRLHRWTEEWMRRLLNLLPIDTLVAEIADRSAFVRWSSGEWESLGDESVKLLRNSEIIGEDRAKELIEVA